MSRNNPRQTSRNPSSDQKMRLDVLRIRVALARRRNLKRHRRSRSHEPKKFLKPRARLIEHF